jgi:hypothetical protein
LHVLLPIVWVVALIAYTVYLLLVPGSASGVLKVFTFFGQSLLLLAQNGRAPWPPVIRQLLHSSSDTGSLSATALECVARGITLTQRYAVYTTTPMLLVAVCVVVFVVGRLRRWAPAYDVLVYMSLSMLLTTYFSISLKALAGFSCTLSDGYLNAYPWIPCDTSASPEFRVVLALSVMCIIVYTLGVPAFAGYHLFRNRTQLAEPHIARRLGFMFGSYQPALFWWEYVITARRLALAMAVTLVPFTQQQLSSVIIMTVLVVSIALQHTFSPFATILENRLEQLSLYVLLLAFLGVYVTDTSSGTSAPLEWLPVLVIVLVSITAVVLLLATAFVLGTRVVPSLAETRFGFWLLSGSEALSGLALKSQALREQLLVPVGKRSGLVAESVADVDAEL